MTKRLRLTHLIPVGLLAAIAATAPGCGGNVSPPMQTTHSGSLSSFTPAKGSKFQHIVIIVQENQSFDHLFNGYPGADTVQSGQIHTGATVPLTMAHIQDATATSHYVVDFLMDYNAGKMNGFDLNTNGPGPTLTPYTFVDPSDIGPYLQMANQYVLADKHFASHLDASLVAHQYIVAAQANGAANLPTGSWGCEGASGDLIPTLNQDRSIAGLLQPPCFTYKNMADVLDTAGLTWRFYAPHISESGGGYSSFQADSDIYNGPEWNTNVISPETTILTDIPNGQLANVTWVVPTDTNSDHPGSNNGGGPSWVASIVNAIGESQFWNSTEIFVTWDEWGGEYDHVPPPYKDFDGLGFRVPLLCISPFAFQGKVNHKQLEMAGILKAVERNFGLSSMAAADKRAAAADSGCINKQQKSPRTFTPISSSLGPNYFLHQKRVRSRAHDDT
jgi:phospholipase C